MELQEVYFLVTVMEKLQQPEVSHILPRIVGVVCMLSLAVSTSALIVTCTISATPVYEGQLTRIPKIIELVCALGWLMQRPMRGFRGLSLEGYASYVCKE